MQKLSDEPKVPFLQDRTKIQRQQHDVYRYTGGLILGVVVIISALQLVHAYRVKRMVSEKWPPTSLSELLFTAGWRNRRGLDNMSSDDKRNTVIVELNKRTTETISTLQGWPDQWLINAGALYLAVWRNGWRDERGMRGMSLDDIRNTCIVELNKKDYGSGGYLQGLSNFQLAELACQYYTWSRQVAQVISFTFHPEQVVMKEQKPIVMKRGEFKNPGNHKMTSTFSYEEQYTERESVSFTRESHWAVDLSVGFEFEVSVPLIKKAKTNINIKTSFGGKTIRNTLKEYTRTKKFSSTNPVEVQPHHIVRRWLVISVCKVDIPFTMVVETKNGERKTLTGFYSCEQAYDEQQEQTAKPYHG